MEVLALVYEDAPLDSFENAVHPKYRVAKCTRDEAMAFVEGNPKDRRTLPQMVFIDKKGRIAAQHRGGSDFLQYDQDREANISGLVKKLLAE